MNNEAALGVEAFDVAALPAGSKQRQHLAITQLPDGAPVSFPALVARGAEPGRTLLATGAVHGDEFEGGIAIQDLFEELDPQSMRGTFVGIPVVNAPAFVAGERSGRHDRHDLARVFPGSAEGTISERIAHALTEHVIPHADLYADLHSAGNVHRITPFAGYQLSASLGEMQRRAAIAFGLDLVWGTSYLPGRSLSAARAKGVPAIYVELEGEGRARPGSRAIALQGLRNLLAMLGIHHGSYPEQARHVVEDDREHSGHLQLGTVAAESGLFLPSVELWDRVEVGQPIGEIRNVDGRVVTAVRASQAGRVLLLRTFPRVHAGELVAFVIEIDEQVETQ